MDRVRHVQLPNSARFGGKIIRKPGETKTRAPSRRGAHLPEGLPKYLKKSEPGDVTKRVSPALND